VGEKTIIAWTDHTFNIAWGCTKVSDGCAHCYAETLAKRYGFKVWGANGDRRVFGEAHWNEPRKWNEKSNPKKPTKVFTSSMCDVFEDHPIIDRERTKLWNLIALTPNLIWQILTKRSERIAECLPPYWDEIKDRIWLGVTVESDKYAYRLFHLNKIPCKVRFISNEPALGPLTCSLYGIKWVIYGGESGVGYRKKM